MKERAQCLQCKIGLNGVIPELGHLLNHKLFNKVTTKYPFNIKLDECLRKVKPVDMVQGKKKSVKHRPMSKTSPFVFYTKTCETMGINLILNYLLILIKTPKTLLAMQV